MFDGIKKEVAVYVERDKFFDNKIVNHKLKGKLGCTIVKYTNKYK